MGVYDVLALRGVFVEKVPMWASKHADIVREAMVGTFCLVPPLSIGDVMANRMVSYLSFRRKNDPSSNATQRCRHSGIVRNHYERSKYYLEGIDHPFVEGISTTAG